MIPKHFDEIRKADIENLIENKVREGRTIDYKEMLIGGKDKDKREFLADVSSFANASGGDLIFGVREKEGIPKEVVGVKADFDKEILRLESIIKDGIEPRIPGIRMRPVEGFEAGPILLIHIPKSWAAPHMVTFKNLSRFFSRNSAGKYQMDVAEIRASFLLSEALSEKIKRFRDERLSRIIANETPVPLHETPKLILHVFPIISFTSNFNFDAVTLNNRTRKNLIPIESSGWSFRFNLDGFLSYNTDGSGYALVFRKGQIEAVWGNLTTEVEGRKYIPGELYERRIVDAIFNFFETLKSLEIQSPIIIFTCLAHVNDVFMGTKLFRIYDNHSIDRDMLILPEVFIEEYELISNKYDIAKILRPIFDAIWNACGFEKSLNFNEQGDWKKEI